MVNGTFRGIGCCDELSGQKDALLREKDMLLEELQHRVANSLQIIAAIILLKSRSVKSEETRLHLQDAHNWVISVAAVQQHLHVSGAAGPIDMAPYLEKLCGSLTTSMIGECRPIVLEVDSGGGSVSSREAVSLGLTIAAWGGFCNPHEVSPWILRMLNRVTESRDACRLAASILIVEDEALVRLLAAGMFAFGHEVHCDRIFDADRLGLIAF
jgi:hypothetical protein